MKRLTSGNPTDREDAPTPEVTEYMGDLLIRDLWHNGTEMFHNVRVMNTNANSHFAKTPEKCLQEVERGKKRMYLGARLQMSKHFSPFIASVDVLMGVEATLTLKRLASRLATKCLQPYSKTCGYVNSRMVITFVRSTHRCIWRSRVSAHRISMHRP